MSQNTHEVIIRLVDQASAGLEKIKKQSDGVVSSIEKNRAGIEAIGLASATAFAALGLGINKSIDASTELENSMKGLKSIVVGTGGDFDKAKKAIQEYTSDGLVTTQEAATSLKNLLSRGYNLDESIKLMDAFKNSATYGRQASLGLGEAVQTATEGLKNENSILVDNAGVTKNVAKMWDEYAKAQGKSMKDLTDAEKRQAEFNGIMQETRFQMKDAATMSDSYAGSVARASAASKTMWATVGDGLKPIMQKLYDVIVPIVSKITEFASANPQLTGTIIVVATAVTGFVAAAAGIALILPSIIAGLGVLGSVIGALFSPIGLIIAAVAGLYYAFSTNFLGIRDIAESVLSWLQEKIGVVWGYISKVWNDESVGIKKSTEEFFATLKQVFSLGMGWIKTEYQAFTAALKEFWDKYGAYIKEAVRIFFEEIKTLFRIGMDIMRSLFENGLRTISGILKVITGIMKGDWQQVWEGIKQIASAALNFIFDIVKSVLTNMNTFIRNVFGVDIAGGISAGWEAAKNKTIQIWEGIKGAVGAGVQWIMDKIRPLMDLMGSVRAQADAISGYVSSKVSAAQSSISSFTTSAKNTISSAVSSVSAKISGARADGGPVSGGKTYLVGERGPELFVPSTTGSIVPNHGMGGQSVTINLGGVTVQNQADENRLVQKIKETIIRERRTNSLGIA